jgi:hypothetical protein
VVPDRLAFLNFRRVALCPRLNYFKIQILPKGVYSTHGAIETCVSLQMQEINWSDDLKRNSFQTEGYVPNKFATDSLKVG